MDITLEALLETGLAKNEAKVYLALLKLGSAPVADITKASKVHRVNVYDVLERLREKGLISTIIQSHKRIYEAAHPQHLLQMVQQKEELLRKVLPSLELDFSAKKERQQVHHFFGVAGIAEAYAMMLRQKQTIYGIGGSGLNRQFLKHRHEMFTTERIRQKILVKGLYYEHTRKPGPYLPGQLAEIRYLPNKYRTLGMVDICGNLVVNLLPVEGNVMAIVIESKTLADTYRQIFQCLWDQAKA